MTPHRSDEHSRKSSTISAQRQVSPPKASLPPVSPVVPCLAALLSGLVNQEWRCAVVKENINSRGTLSREPRQRAVNNDQFQGQRPTM
ncbi:hypothetical protein LSAT2_022314 [Lamellibrachia satsuma]|nr:hypothetical protein LSAT2_022314 [Lamellibrachia satsuma]